MANRGVRRPWGNRPGPGPSPSPQSSPSSSYGTVGSSFQPPGFTRNSHVDGQAGQRPQGSVPAPGLPANQLPPARPQQRLERAKPQDVGGDGHPQSKMAKMDPDVSVKQEMIDPAVLSWFLHFLFAFHHQFSDLILERELPLRKDNQMSSATHHPELSLLNFVSVSSV